MPAKEMNGTSFAEKYCERRQVDRKKYLEAVMQESLYPVARLLRPFLLLRPGYFDADREFISSVGLLTRARDFDVEAADFRDQPSNRWFLRRILKLRVSTVRLGKIVREILRDGSTQPFQAAPPPAS